MIERDLHWLAGFLEGEGSFLFSRATVKATGYVKHNFSVSAASVDRDVLERAADLIGVTVRGPYHSGNEKHQPYWTIRLACREDVLRLTRKLRPLMGERRQQQIDAVLKADEQYPPRRLGRPKTERPL